MSFSKSKVTILIMVFLLALPGLTNARQNFNDVGGTHWAKDAIDSLVQLGVVQGMGNGSFKPDEQVTREQFAQMLTLGFFLDLPDSDEQSFMDVSPGRWSYPAVEAAKDFLTGYYAPNGKAFFDPTGKATREDVAVALVRTLGYQPDELENANILNQFYDGNAISPNLQTYVALAIEKKLLNGYENRTIRPGNPVTRAEAAALIFRVIKNASGDGLKQLSFNVNAPETTNSSTFYISGDTTPGAKVYMNNNEVEVLNGQFRVAVKLDEEGTYTYVMLARLPGGKTETITKRVTYEKGAPTLEVTGVPESTDKQSVTVSWKTKDESDYSPVVFVNEERQHAYTDSKTIELKEGTNTITVRAQNASGKSTQVTKQVIFTSGGPVLNVNELPATTGKDTVTVNWSVQDRNDTSPKVYVNEKLQSSYTSATDIKLTPGMNTITLRAENKLGKTTIVTRQIQFTSAGPTLAVDPLPSVTTKKNLSVSWRVSDPNDSSPRVSINDESQSAYVSNATLTLKPGVNDITFKAINKLGDTTEQSHSVIFEPSAPVLTLGYVPESTSSPRFTLSWTVSDENESYPKVYVNDQLVNYVTTLNVTLTPGDNTFKIVAANGFGKTTEVTCMINYTPAD